MKIKQIIILFFIVLSGLVFLFRQLGQNLKSFHSVELDTGYSAFSLLKTLHDLYGNFLFIQFKDQVDNYRPLFSIYVTISSVAIFGINIFSERLLSAKAFKKKKVDALKIKNPEGDTIIYI